LWRKKTKIMASNGYIPANRCNGLQAENFSTLNQILDYDDLLIWEWSKHKSCSYFSYLSKKSSIIQIWCCMNKIWLKQLVMRNKPLCNGFKPFCNGLCAESLFQGYLFYIKVGSCFPQTVKFILAKYILIFERASGEI
jgi:hypothetical protein